MARSIDSDYLDLSLHGFDIGIDFDVFEENMRRIMELPIKYLDSAHGKAVELIEDVHAMLRDTFPDGEVPNELHDTVKDASNSSVSGSLPVSVETKIVRASDEVPNRESLISVENGFTGSIDKDACETQSVLTKNAESLSSRCDHVNTNDLCLLPKDALATEVHEDSTTSEEIILWNPENSAKPPQLPEPTTIADDDCVPHALDTGKVTEQVGLPGSAYSDIQLENSGANNEGQIVLHSAEDLAEDPVEAAAPDQLTDKQNAEFKKAFSLFDKDCDETVSCDSNADVSKCADDSTMCPDVITQSVSIDHGNGQENMKNDMFVVSNVSTRQNPSFKKMLMRKLSSKLWWSKKPAASVQQAVPDRSESEDGEGLRRQLVTSSDGLDDEWELVEESVHSYDISRK